MSTKYQRPNADYAGDAALNNRTKYQDDASAEPKVAISSAKMDGDFNYVVDALNGIDAASGSRTSIDDRLSVSINADGTLKGSVVATVDDWVAFAATGMTRLDNSSFQVDGDHTSLFTDGKRVKLLVDSVTLYADVAQASLVTGNTQVSCVDIVDATGAVAVISTTPSSLHYAPFDVGSTGNMQTDFADLKVRGAPALLRLTNSSGDEYGLRVQSNQLEFVENTGTELAPTWASRGSVNSSGIVFSDGTVTVSQMADGTAGELLSWGTDGSATAVATGSAGDVLTSAGAGQVPSFQNVFPSGLVMPFAGGTVPTGWFLCDGSELNRITYADLFAVIGTTYGVGDGTVTFNLPDLRGRTIFGLDTMGGSAASRLTSGGSGMDGATLGAVGGHEMLQEHTHTVTDAGHSHVQGMISPASGTRYGTTTTGTGATYYDSGTSSASDNVGANTSTDTTGISIDNVGMGDSQNMPPAIVMNWMIKG